MNSPFEWPSFLTAEKFIERSGLNQRHPPTPPPQPHPSFPQTRKGALIWKFAMSAEALIQTVCKNDETRFFSSQIFFVFYNKDICKHILEWFLS